MAFDPIAYINEPRWQQSRLGLHRMEALLAEMGDPQRSLDFVHVAGTNGKGSTCAYLASMLQAAGYRTGLFTSPYVVRFQERIRVDGRDIPLEELRECTLAVRECATAVEERLGEHPTEFELMCAVALEHFKRSGCRIVVLEVGLGGRLDATNVIPAPLVAVICRLGLDHTALLGETLGEIAAEKAGIVKPGSTVVAWPQEDPAARQLLAEAAQAAGDPLVEPDFSKLSIGAMTQEGRRPFTYQGRPFETQLLGSYQPYNAALALEAAAALVAKGFPMSRQAQAQGIAQAVWPGRFQLLEAAPVPVIADGGHNAQGARALAASLQDAFPSRKAVFIMAVLADKDYGTMAAEVAPKAKAFICTTPDNPRALPAQDLAAYLQEHYPSIPAETASTPQEALAKARSQATQDDVICIFGSLYALAPYLQMSQREAAHPEGCAADKVPMGSR